MLKRKSFMMIAVGLLLALLVVGMKAKLKQKITSTTSPKIIITKQKQSSPQKKVGLPTTGVKQQVQKESTKYKLASRSKRPADYLLRATAYTHTGNRTASGIWPKRGHVAVDPKLIPLGTKLFVEGYGPAVAVDTGDAIKGHRMDVFFETEKEARKWGKRFKVRVWITDYGGSRFNR